MKKTIHTLSVYVKTYELDEDMPVEAILDGKHLKEEKLVESRLLGGRVHVVYDENPEDPRDWDNIGTMLCWLGNRYSLGDKNEYEDSFDFILSMADYIARVNNPRYADWFIDRHIDNDVRLEAACKLIDKHYAVICLKVNIHSGSTIRVSNIGIAGYDPHFHAGIIYAPLGTEGLSREQLIGLLKGEVEAYDKYLRGEVYRTDDRRESTKYGITDDCSFGGFDSVDDAVADIKSYGITDYEISIEV